MYISIASYRDPLLQSTIDDAFAKATYPDELEIGCFIQIIESDPDKDYQLISNNYKGKVKYEVRPAGEVFSVTQCRELAKQWLKPQHKYVLQIDSHSRFQYGWDKSLIDSYEALDKTNCVFSSYLPPWYPEPNGQEVFKKHYSNYFSEAVLNNSIAKQYFLNTYEIVPDLKHKEKNPDKPARTWYTCGHFIFASAEYFLSVKQPDWILFWGEEVYNSLITFTNGWDVLVPEVIPVRHMFPQDVPHLKLNKLWCDFSDRWIQQRDKATDRVIDAIINRTTGENYLGTKRSLDELYNLIGYDLGLLLKEWRNEYRQTN